MREYALVLLVTAAVTYLLTPLVRRIAVAALAAAAERRRVLTRTRPERDADHPARRGHHQRDQPHRRPRRPGGGHRGRRRAVVPGVLLHADPDHRQPLTVAPGGGVRAA